MLKKTIVISAINLIEGGPLTILQECLKYLSDSLSYEYEIIALVNKKELFSFGNIKYIEFPWSKKFWFFRIYYEYCYFSKLSKHLNPFLWLSLHDITPDVTANRRAVYCHNSSPFYRLSFKDTILDPKFALFNTFYKSLYKINIKRNDFVIVQQSWFRQKLCELYKIDKIIVSCPQVHNKYLMKEKNENIKRNNSLVFFYPSFPRVFKNFEVICEAANILIKEKICNFKIYFTINGKENRYSKYIFNRYKYIKNIHFIGLLSHAEVYDYYDQTDCLIFSSKLETWGLPITEFKSYGKPILAADLEYARETVGNYAKVKFFDPNNEEQLSICMKAVIKNSIIFDDTDIKKVKAPFSSNWKELFDILLDEDKKNYV